MNWYGFGLRGIEINPVTLYSDAAWPNFRGVIDRLGRIEAQLNRRKNKRNFFPVPVQSSELFGIMLGTREKCFWKVSPCSVNNEKGAPRVI